QRARAASGIENAKAGTDERRAKKERAQSLRVAHRTDEAHVRRMSVGKESPRVWRCVQRDTPCGCVRWNPDAWLRLARPGRRAHGRRCSLVARERHSPACL